MKGDAVPVGICGLVRRDEFPDPDLGFAFLKDHWSNGYALESSLAVLRHSRETLGLTRIIALADKDNLASTKLLERLGFKFECKVTMPGETAEVCRYGIGN
jgi:RimJ/RimL family protein N-acetyltransferase